MTQEKQPTIGIKEYQTGQKLSPKFSEGFSGLNSPGRIRARLTNGNRAIPR
jgi:hypothetical protein